MKKFIILSIVLTMIFQIAWMDPYNSPHNQIQTVQTYSALNLPEKMDVDYTGDSDYLTRINNFNFNDVSGADKINAIRLALFDITSGIGKSKFGGKRKASNIETLTMLVRMFSDDTALVKNVIDNNQGASQTAISQALRDAYYQEAKTIGILQANEEVSYTALVTREQLARWLIGAGNIPSVVGENDLKKASDWQTIKPENVDAVETLIDQDIMDTTAKGRFEPRRQVTRAELAGILAQVFVNFPDKVKVSSHYGIVIGKHTTTKADETTVDIIVRDKDNTIKKIQLKKDNKSEDKGLSVYKKGQLTSHKSLVIGDEIHYLLKDKVVMYTVVLSPYEVSKRLLETLQGLENIKLHQGVVLSNLMDKDSTKGNVTKRRIRIELDDDAMIELVDTFDHNTNIENKYLVKEGAKFISPQQIKKGESVTVYTQGDKVLYVVKGREGIKKIKGSIRLVDETKTPAELVILDFNNQVHTLPVAQDADISINYYKAKLSDLKVGANTTVQVLNGRAVHIVSDSYQPTPGYIPQEGKIKYATVQSINGDYFKLMGESKLYAIDNNTQFYSGEQQVTAKSLKPGDKVKLYFNDIYTTTPSKIVIEGIEQLINKLIKGKLYSYNQFTDEITVSDRYFLQNTIWKSENTPFIDTYKLSKDVVIYDGNQRIDETALNGNYNKRDAYYVVKDNYGRKEVVKIVFKDGFEKHYNDVVDDYSNVLNRMELKNKVNINYDDGTIFVQNDRVVDKSILKDNVNIYVLSNQTRGVDKAQIVNVLGDYNDMFRSIYVASIESVNPYNVAITNFASVDKFKWGTLSTSKKTLSISDETTIYDGTKKKFISREILFNNPYNREENKSKDGRGMTYERYYGFFVTDGYDNVIAMKIRFKELVKNDNIDDRVYSESGVIKKMQDIVNASKFTMGTIIDFNKDWKRIELKDSYNYVEYHGEWAPNKTSTYSDLASAIIMKGGVQIEYEDLKIGDKVHIIRYNEDALVVYVNE